MLAQPRETLTFERIGATLATSAAAPIFPGMIRIAISQATFDAIASTLPCNVSFENARATNGDWFIWLPRDVLEKLNQWRTPGEGYSAVILRLAEDVTVR